MERSTNGTNFSEIGIIQVPSATVGVKAYDFKDTQPVEGNNSYRLKFLEVGSAARYSPVVVIRFSALDKTIIYPNPVRGRLITISLSKPITGTADIWLTNTTGAIMHQQKIQGFNQRQLKINLPQSVPAGTYILEINSAQGIKESIMIMCL